MLGYIHRYDCTAISSVEAQVEVRLKTSLARWDGRCAYEEGCAAYAGLKSTSYPVMHFAECTAISSLEDEVSERETCMEDDGC